MAHTRFCDKLKTRYVSSQQTQNICITFVQRRPNVFDVGPTLYKYYTNVLCFTGFAHLYHVYQRLKRTKKGVLWEDPAASRSLCHGSRTIGPQDGPTLAHWWAYVRDVGPPVSQCWSVVTDHRPRSWLKRDTTKIKTARKLVTYQYNRKSCDIAYCNSCGHPSKYRTFV